MESAFPRSTMKRPWRHQARERSKPAPLINELPNRDPIQAFALCELPNSCRCGLSSSGLLFAPQLVELVNDEFNGLVVFQGSADEALNGNTLFGRQIAGLVGVLHMRSPSNVTNRLYAGQGVLSTLEL